MSDTPRTDDAVGECVHYEALCDMVEAEFARTLERENAAMREAIREANATLEDWELLWKEQAGLVSSRAFSDGRPVSKASMGARSKLQPFLKP